MGLNSLPVAFGPETAKWITVGTIDVTQLSVAAYLVAGLHEPIYGAVLFALVLPQVRVPLLACRCCAVPVCRQCSLRKAVNTATKL